MEGVGTWAALQCQYFHVDCQTINLCGIKHKLGGIQRAKWMYCVVCESSSSKSYWNLVSGLTVEGLYSNRWYVWKFFPSWCFVEWHTTAKLVHLEMTWGWILRLLPSPPHPPTAQRPRGRSCHAVSSLARLSVICYKTVKVWWYVGKTFKVKGMCAWGSKTIKNEEEKISTTHVFDFHDSRIYVFTAHFSVVCATFKDQELCYLMGNPSWPTDLCSISSALALSTLILLHIIERRF